MDNIWILLSPALLLSAGPAFAAGYGDDPDGELQYEEMELLLWVNAARVAPSEQESSTEEGGCSYGSGTGYVPMILSLNAESLAQEAAQEEFPCADEACVVSEVVRAQSSGESIEDFVLDTVLCDDDARALLRAEGDLAFGVELQDLDEGEGVMASLAVEALSAEDDQPLLGMGLCDQGGSCMATWRSPDGAKPERLVATDGHRELPLKYAMGRTDSGLYSRVSASDVSDDDLGCDPYWFVWETENGSGTFPEEGALSAEDCPDFWVERHFPRGWFCGTPGPAAALGSALSALAALLRRRGQ